MMNVTPFRTAGAAAAILVAIGFPACGSDDNPEAGTDAPTALAVSSDYEDSYTLMDEEFGTMVTVIVDGETRSIESNSLPDHETGEFPNDGNPNTISEQSLSYEFTTEPVFTGDAAFAQTAGVAVNGVPFEPGTGESVSCESGESYRIEALQDLYNLGLDTNNAHVQPTGKYHYHGVSELLVEAYESDDDLVHVGFAADGYLMYYSKSGAYEPSFGLADEARTGTECLASGPGNESFDIDGTSPDGTYVSDWVYSDGAGDLDSCNGVTIDGEYVYLLTDEYLYIPRCLNGESAGGAPDGPPPGGGVPEDGAAQENGAAPTDGAAQENGAPPAAGGGPGSGDAPDLSEAAATLGVTEAELQAALGERPPDLDAAASALGISVEELQVALPQPGGGEQPAAGN